MILQETEYRGTDKNLVVSSAGLKPGPSGPSLLSPQVSPDQPGLWHVRGCSLHVSLQENALFLPSVTRNVLFHTRPALKPVPYHHSYPPTNPWESSFRPRTFIVCFVF